MKILIVGGSGFVGSNIKNKLERDHEVYLLGRNLDEGKFNIKGDITNPETLSILSQYNFDAVINCVGLSPIGYKPFAIFQKVHIDGVDNLLKAAKSANIPRFIHISALGVKKETNFAYILTKYIADQLIVNSGTNYLILRPSMILGEDNELTKMIKSLSLFNVTILPKVKTFFQPVEINDLTQLISDKLTHFKNEIIEVGGKSKVQLGEILYNVAKDNGLKVIRVPLPKPLLKLSLWLAAKLKLTNNGLEEYLLNDNTLSVQILK